MKTPHYELVTLHDKQEDGTFKDRYVVYAPGSISPNTFYSLHLAREFIRIDQIPTPPRTVERIPAKLTPEQRLSIREARRQKQNEDRANKEEEEYFKKYHQDAEDRRIDRRIETIQSQERQDGITIAVCLLILATLTYIIFF